MTSNKFDPGWGSSDGHHSNRSISAIDTALFVWLAAILLFAPLIKGGNRPLPMMVMELTSLPVWLYLAWETGWIRKTPRLLLVGLGVLFFYPVLQWLPLPFSNGLPGWSLYQDAVKQVVGDDGNLPWQTLSIVPEASFSAWLALLPPIAVLLITLKLNDRFLKILVYLLVAMAGVQAFMALLQYGGGAGGTEFRVSPMAYGQGLGTYANHNHLAGLLEMALPIALGSLASCIGRDREDLHYVGKGWRNKLTHFFLHVPRVNSVMLFTSVSILILLGLIFSRSRAGISLGMLGIFLSAALYGRHIGGVRSQNATMFIVVIGLAIAVLIGLSPVLQRFSLDETLGDARWPILWSSLYGALTFLPFGSGLGTFPEVYWRFEPGSLGLFVNHAHNDYVELIFELGVFALFSMVMLVAVYILRWPGLFRNEHWARSTFMQIGAGIGLFVLALHGLTDYNLHIPANAIYFAFLAGVFFHRSVQKQIVGRFDNLKDRESSVDDEKQYETRVSKNSQQTNPFSLD